MRMLKLRAIDFRDQIRIAEKDIEISTFVWSNDERTFIAGPVKCFAR